MLEYKTGDLFSSGAEVLVNPVNCVGVMGKGLALEFRKRFPWIRPEYERLCRERRMQPGSVWLVYPPGAGEPRVALAATKGHWKCASQLTWIDEILVTLRGMTNDVCSRYRTLAMPWLGCGLGGLKREDVKLLVDRRFKGVDEVKVTVWTPEGT
ncbi:MAG: macro domain-containing protein [Armatimonadia bacterium]